jgi:hypothetical protein
MSTAGAGDAMPESRKRRHDRVEEGIRRSEDGAAPPQKRFFRMRAHINPLSTGLSYE